MAELDPYIIFRQKEYAGPTQDELDAKQDMNALRNMLGAGRTIDSPEVVNAMMARNPDLGLKLMTNASTMQTNAASAQKSIADARAKQQEARLAELDRYFPVGMAIAQAGDQEGWDQFGTFLGQKFGPDALMGYPRNVKQAGAYLQQYLEAKRQYEAKNGGNTPRFGAPTATAEGFMQIDPTTGKPALLINPATGKPYMPPPKGGDGGSEETFGMSPEGGYDAEGNYVPLFRSNRGRITAPGLPPGITYAPSVKAVDTGTGTAFAGPGGRVMGTVVPKDVQGEALMKEAGKERGAQLMAAPQAVATGSRFLAQLDDLAADPNLERGTGLSSYFNFIPGTAGKAFQVKLNKATGSGFLESINYLRGTGAISNTEGTAATSSISGLDAGLDADAFRKEIKILRDIVARGLEKAIANAAERDRILGITSSTGAPAPAPTGAGSNPADPLGLLGGE